MINNAVVMPIYNGLYRIARSRPVQRLVNNRAVAPAIKGMYRFALSKRVSRYLPSYLIQEIVTSPLLPSRSPESKTQINPKFKLLLSCFDPNTRRLFEHQIAEASPKQIDLLYSNILTLYRKISLSADELPPILGNLSSGSEISDKAAKALLEDMLSKIPRHKRRPAIDTLKGLMTKASEYIKWYFTSFPKELLLDIFASEDYSEMVSKIEKEDLQWFLIAHFMDPGVHIRILCEDKFSRARSLDDMDRLYFEHKITVPSREGLPLEFSLGYIEELFGMALREAGYETAMLRSATQKSASNIQQIVQLNLQGILSLKYGPRKPDVPVQDVVNLIHGYAYRSIESYAQSVHFGPKIAEMFISLNEMQKLEEALDSNDPSSSIRMLPVTTDFMGNDWLFIQNGPERARRDWQELSNKKTFGKWAYRNASLVDAVEAAKKLVPYIKNGTIVEMKLLLLERGTQVGPFSVVFCDNRNQRIRKILKSVLKAEPEWVFEWQTLEYSEMVDLAARMLIKINGEGGKLKSQKALSKEELIMALRDNKVKRRIPLSNFQISLLLASLKSRKELADDPSLLMAEFAQALKCQLCGREVEVLNYLVKAPEFFDDLFRRREFEALLRVAQELAPFFEGLAHPESTVKVMTKEELKERFANPSLIKKLGLSSASAKLLLALVCEKTRSELGPEEDMTMIEGLEMVLDGKAREFLSILAQRPGDFRGMHRLVKEVGTENI